MNAADGEGFVRNMNNSYVSSRTNDLEVENGSYYFIYDLSLHCVKFYSAQHTGKCS